MRITEIDNKLFEKCWKGYEKKGMKKMFGKTVPNCVKKESVLDEDYIISLKGKEVSRHKEENEARSAWHKLRKQHGNDVTIKKESVLDEDLRAWFGKGKKGDWVDIGAPKKKGRYQACGRKSAKKSKRAYPKCVPRSKARSMTAAQRRSAVARKRRAGNPGGKPTNVKTIVKRKRRATKKKK